MKAVILAAGTGSRLAMDLPKALVEVFNGTTILDLQLDNLSKVMSMNDVILVKGFRKDFFDEKYHYLKSVYNPEYETTNTSKSLLMALEALGNEDVIFMNGDVVYDRELLPMIVTNNKHNLISVNNASVDDEEVKYSLDEEGFIGEISKSVPEPLGEAVGINYIKKDNVDILKHCLDECGNDDYFEKGIEKAIDKGVKFAPLNIGNMFCVEIDFADDLKVVFEYLKDGHWY